MFTLDVMHSEDGPTIIEVGEPGCATTPDMDRALAVALHRDAFNPRGKPVIIIQNEVCIRQPDRGLVRTLVDDGVFSREKKGQIHSVSFDTYNRIIVDRANTQSNRGDVTSRDPNKTIAVNSPFFNQLSRGKFLALYCLTNVFSPETGYFGKKFPLGDSFHRFVGKDVVLKSSVGARSVGIRYVDGCSLDKVRTELGEFKVTPAEWPGLIEGSEFHDRLNGNYFPDIIQQRVKSVKIRSEYNTRRLHETVDRVAVLVSSNNGGISVEYLGGFHRFRITSPGQKPVNRPLSINLGTAFPENLTPKQHNEMQDFVQGAIPAMYRNALSFPPMFYQDGPDVVGGQPVDFSRYLAA